MQRRDFLKFASAGSVLGLLPGSVLAHPSGAAVSVQGFRDGRRLMAGPLALRFAPFGQAAWLSSTGQELIQDPAPQRCLVDAAWSAGRGELLLLDAGQQRLERYARDGRALGVWSLPASPGWRALAVDSEDRLWLADGLKHRLWQGDGEHWQALSPTAGLEPGQLNGARALVFDRDRNLHILNSGNGRIDVLDREARPLAHYAVGTPWPRALAITDDDAILVLGDAGRQLHGFRNGQRLWRTDLGQHARWQHLSYARERGLYLSA